MLPGMQRVEVGDAIDAQHDGLSVDDESGLAHLAGRFDDPRISVGEVLAATGHQAHALAVALKPQPVAVILDFVKLFRACWDLGADYGDAELIRP